MYVCVHAYADYFFRLRYLVDVYAAMQQPSFQRDKTMALATRYGVERHVQEAIELAEYFFGEADIHSLGKYSRKVIDHLISTDGFPKRVHPNSKQWTRQDKNKHLIRQIKNRSCNVSWYAPIAARLKFSFEDIQNGASRPSARLFYLRRLITKLFRVG